MITYLCQETTEKSELISHVWEDVEVCYSFWTESFTDDISWYDSNFIIHFLIRFEVQILILFQWRLCIIDTMCFSMLVCRSLICSFMSWHWPDWLDHDQVEQWFVEVDCSWLECLWSRSWEADVLVCSWKLVAVFYVVRIIIKIAFEWTITL